MLDERTPLPELGIEPGMTLQLEPFLVVRMPHAEDSEEVQRLNAVWMRVDADGSGALDLDEMRAVFAELGEELSDEELLEKFQVPRRGGRSYGHAAEMFVVRLTAPGALFRRCWMRTARASLKRRSSRRGG